MRRLGVSLGTLAVIVMLAAPGSAVAWHPANPKQIKELTGAASAEVSDARISKRDENWAAATVESPPIDEWTYFHFIRGAWQDVAGSSGCLPVNEIPGIPIAVALELGACRVTAPVPLTPYSLFAFGPESNTGEDVGTIHLSVSACSPTFYDLAWTSYAHKHATATGLGRFPYFPTAETYCEDAPVHRVQVHILLSRPRHCDGVFLFTEIHWRGEGEKGKFRSVCKSPYQ